MMPARQLVRREHADERTNRAAHDEHNICRHKGHRGAEHWLAADDERIIKGVREPNQSDDIQKHELTASKCKPADERIFVAHHLFHSMNWKRREHVPFTIAGVADFFRGVQKRGSRIEFGDEAVNFHFAAPFAFGLRCGSASGITPLTSEIATIGKNFTNSKYIVKKTPSVPM